MGNRDTKKADRERLLIRTEAPKQIDAALVQAVCISSYCCDNILSIDTLLEWFNIDYNTEAKLAQISARDSNAMVNIPQDTWSLPSWCAGIDYGKISKPGIIILKDAEDITTYNDEYVYHGYPHDIDKTCRFNSCQEMPKAVIDPKVRQEIMAKEDAAIFAALDAMSANMTIDKCEICGSKDPYINFSTKHNKVVCYECFGK